MVNRFLGVSVLQVAGFGAAGACAVKTADLSTGNMFKGGRSMTRFLAELKALSTPGIVGHPLVQGPKGLLSLHPPAPAGVCFVL